MEQLELADLDFAAQLQARALSHGFFTALGRRFLRAYLRGFVESPYAVALVAHGEGRRLGFVVGALANVEHRRWLLRRRGVRLALLAASALVRRPRLARRFVATRLLRYLRALGRRLRPQRSGRSRSEADSDRLAVLAHVAVAPDARGHGVGRCLERTFVALAREAEARSVYLVTLVGPRGATDFYEAGGWRAGHERFDADGDRTVEYVLDL